MHKSRFSLLHLRWVDGFSQACTITLNISTHYPPSELHARMQMYESDRLHSVLLSPITKSRYCHRMRSSVPLVWCSCPPWIEALRTCWRQTTHWPELIRLEKARHTMSSAEVHRYNVWFLIKRSLTMVPRLTHASQIWTELWRNLCKSHFLFS